MYAALLAWSADQTVQQLGRTQVGYSMYCAGALIAEVNHAGAGLER
jgi:hypothetical protein